MTAAAASDLRAELARSAEAAWGLAEHLTTLASGTARAAEGLPEVTGWQGRAAVAATAGLNRREGRLEQVATAFGAAAGAAREHAAALRVAAAQLAPQAGPAALDPAAVVRAATVAEESDRRSAGRLGGLAATAPPRRSGWRQGLATLDSWVTHFDVGVVESVAGLGMFALTAANTPVGVRPQHGVYDPGDLLGVLGDPVGLARDVVDWDTWRDDPARALGHLGPDLAAAALGAGTAAGLRARRIEALTEKASATAAYRQDSMLAQRWGAAGAARDRLIRRSLETGAEQAPSGSGWRLGKSRLSPLANAQVEAFHRLNAAGEPALLERMLDVTLQVDARLEQLDRRLKSPESLKRKVAGFRRGDLAQRLAKADDVVRFTMVFDGPAYTASAHRAAELLTASGLHLDRIWQAWDLPENPYRGINTFWVDPRTGVKVELQFHTPASRQATIDTHPQYEEKREAGTSKPRKAELDTEMFEAFQFAEYPPGVLSIEEQTLIPPPPPDPIVQPPDLALRMAVLAGAAAGTASRSG